jgi:hypothetical protein
MVTGRWGECESCVTNKERERLSKFEACGSL